MGLNVDILDETQTLDGYRLVIAPMLYMFKHGIQEKLRSFTADGGTLVMTFWSGPVSYTHLDVYKRQDSGGEAPFP